MHRTFRVAAVSLLLWIPWGQSAAQTADRQAFDQGAAAFRGGDYAGALRSFLEAQRAGMDTPGLRYNLGAVYYKLQRYPEAEREFQLLARDSAWAPLASYNLGLIAQRTGRWDLARARFEQALQTSTDPDLRTLAAVALGRLEAERPTRVFAVASLAAGYDSNAPLAPDAATAGTSHQSDVFAEAFAAGSYRLGGSATSRVDAQAGFALRKYQDLHDFDQASLRLGLSHDGDWGRWRSSVGGFFDSIYFGGDPFQRAAVLEARGRRLLGSGDVRGRYEYQRIEGGPGFEYLDGWQQQLTVDAGAALASALARAGYQLELNDRRDLEQGGDFFSYSPTRHSVFATVILPNFAGWGIEARGEYRLSRYGDPYRTGGTDNTREDKRYGGAVHAYRRLGGPWRAFVDYSSYRNQSTIDTYDYGRQQVLAGVEIVVEK
jgi:tetratricopeptide (TPR) repeat protein